MKGKKGTWSEPCSYERRWLSWCCKGGLQLWSGTERTRSAAFTTRLYWRLSRSGTIPWLMSIPNSTTHSLSLHACLDACNHLLRLFLDMLDSLCTTYRRQIVLDA